ncbi:MAG: methyltransferase domain-containing protein [Phycisphaerales bacterium]|nr:methyltransferase domain-containing protein [Phycisphaerales bacterium]
MSNTTIDREYVLGTDEQEHARLSLQHALWADAAIGQWARAGFGPGDTVIDVGCGPGFGSRDLARLLGPSGKVIAVDESQRFLDYIDATPTEPGCAPIETSNQDVQRLNLPGDGADGAYCRWVLHFTPDPQAVIRSVHRALKPGGVFAIQDYCRWQSIFWAPNKGGVETLRKCILASYASHKANSDVGQMLPTWMEEVGFDVVEIRPLQRIARPGDALWQWPTTYFDSFLPRLVKTGFMTQDEFETVMTEWRELGEQPGAFFFSPPQVEVIGVRR